MNRIRIAVSRVVASALVLGAVASTPAFALPHLFGGHRHPEAAAGEDHRISLCIVNQADRFRDVKIDGKVYTVMPHQGLSVKAPVGTPVYTESTADLHRKGDLLFTIDAAMENRGVDLN